LTKPALKKVKPTAILLLILMATFMSLSQLPKTSAAASIISMTPTSGNVGTLVNLEGNISSPGGTYEIRFDGTTILSRSAVGTDVTVSFRVPDATTGNHVVMLFDVSAAENATQNFTVSEAYGLKAEVPTLPKQLQEGDSVTLNVTVTGGNPTTLYAANIRVENPSNVSSSQLVNFTTSATGSGGATLWYPDEFPTGANTSIAGNYTAFFNSTFSTLLETDTFIIGLTNSTIYHRNQAIDVKAVYEPFENVTVSIAGNVVYYPENVTADNTGIIHFTNWTVPNDAMIDTYTVRITSISNLTRKTPSDIQNFTVPGYTINFTTVNLAGEPVPNVTFSAVEKGITAGSNVSNSIGMLLLRLESGTFDCEARYKSIRVGEGQVTITEEAAVNFTCSLTNLRVLVVDAQANRIPDVKVFLAPDNKTLTTALNGTVAFTSLLPNITYTLNSSRYDMLFNTTAVSELPATAWYETSIICPTLTMQVNVVDVSGNPINNAVVKIGEFIGGLQFEGTTVNGVVTHDFIFGRYNVEIYFEGTRLNKTTVDLNSTLVTVSIKCELFGLTVTFRVVDYFGQPIPNANVTLQRDQYRASSFTGGDGSATFNNVIGGDLQVAVYLSGQSQPCEATTAGITNSTTIEIKIDKYTLVAGLVVETSQLATVIIIVLVVVFILALELYRRRRSKQPKAETEQE
jgi:hypothetical protein